MYLEYFALTDKPFEITPDPKFLFLNTGHRQALEAVLQGLQEGKSAILLSGEVGTGKTLLVYTLLARLPEGIKTALIFHSTQDFQELMGQVLSELGQPAPSEDRKTLIGQWLAYLRQVRQQGGRVVVIIDEAQKLSRNVLEDLFALWDLDPDVQEVFQLILSGQPELEQNVLGQLIKNPTLKNSTRTRIAPLSYQESLEYIEHRLRITGGNSARLFSNPALSWICEYAGGIPRLINIACDNALLYAYSQGRRTVDLDIVQKVIANLSGPDTGEQKPADKSRETPPPQPRLSRTQKKGLAVAVVLSLLTFFFFLAKDWLVPSPGIKISSHQTPPTTKQDLHPSLQAGDLPRESKPSSLPPADQGVFTSPSQATESRASSPPESPRVSKIILVEKGKNLTGLVKDHYGRINRSLLDLVLTYNPSITDADLILVNQKIRFPEIREESLLMAGPDNTVSVNLGIFPNLGQAEKFAGLPALRPLKTAIIPRKITASQTWYRIEAIGYPSRQEAQAAAAALKDRGILPIFKEQQ